MKYEITKEQILEAHKDACSQWKEKIESWFPNVFKNTFVVGEWYKHKSGTIMNFQGNDSGYGWHTTDGWCECKGNLTCSDYPFNWTTATYEEVKTMLINEANKRGFKYGVTFYGVVGVDKNRPIEIGKNKNISMNQHGLYCEDSYIFFNGKWATIVEQAEEITIEEIEKQLGKKIKIIS